MKFILASNSPRRRELLGALISDFTVEPSHFSEEGAGLSARDTALAFACGKAADVAARRPGCAVLGADTVVALGNRILGKPRSADEARRMLALLSGKVHTVYTGVCLIAPQGTYSDVVETRVYFRPLEEELIEAYVESGLPMDKAGAYGIQDGYPLVDRYEGSFTNVVGLPVERLKAILREAGLI